MIKVALLMVIFNKLEFLPSVLHSVAMQKISPEYSLDYYVADDGSDNDPEKMVKQFLPQATYKRFDKNYGFLYGQSKCFREMLPSDTDIVIIQASDVICTTSHTYQDLCEDVGKKTVSIAEVVNMSVSPNFHLDFDNNISEIMPNWDKYIFRHQTSFGDSVTITSTLFTGMNRSWLFFLGAARYSDLALLGFKNICCDAVVGQKMKANDFIASIRDDVKAIHCQHDKFIYYCPIVTQCPVKCVRKNLPDVNNNIIMTMDLDKKITMDNL